MVMKGVTMLLLLLMKKKGDPSCSLVSLLFLAVCSYTLTLLFVANVFCGSISAR